MNDLIIYTPEIRLFTYHLRLLKFTDIKADDQIIDLKSIIRYYVQILEQYGLTDSLLQKLGILALHDADQCTSQEQGILYEKRLLEALADLLEDFIFRSDIFEQNSTEFVYEPPILPLIINRKDASRLGIERVALPPYLGFFYPQYFHDTYSFLLHLYHLQKRGEDGVPCSELNQLKPPDLFFTGTTQNLSNHKQLEQAFWGTTLMFNGFVAAQPDSIEAGQAIAHQLLQTILGLNTLEKAPPFLQSGEFLGGFLYEYRSLDNPHPLGQVLILLMFCNDTKKKLNKVQLSFPPLFNYDHKIQQNFFYSRQVYKNAQAQIKQIEAIINKFPQNIATNISPDLSDDQLKALKQEIKNLLDLSLAYSQKIRNLVIFQNTIAINAANYLETLSQIERTSESDLAIWRNKANQRFTTFQRQIEVDLVYLQQGERLLDTAINTIRGLVEIDQAERDRLLEQRIQIIGVGITAGAIVASTSPLIFDQPWTLPGQANQGESWHPFIVAIVLSVAASLGFSALTWLLLKMRKP
ncbi:MAG: hypothetical protein EA366_09960 [Spirulina sp. DLM2.Bin59]|nr:MAG: hypothetical protein EA366_09960 [Spirulina sp. DLM2.Bin59]